MTKVLGIERVASGVPGLDAVLRGGFPKGGIHIIQGPPGTGKTTLGNQLCYHHAAAGCRALYVTLLAESHARMLVHLGTMTFFDPTRLPEQISYVSGLAALDAEGLSGLVALLRREIGAHRATVMLLDGLIAAEDRATSEPEFKKFIQDLQMQAGLHGCTVFLLTTAKGQANPSEHTMVDGIVELADIQYESRTERGLSVKKLRGSDYLPGRHSFRITQDGLVVYPRIEAALHFSTVPDKTWSGKLSTGIAALDVLIGGGLPEATVLGLLGPSGIGKTTVGLHFISHASVAEPGLFFGFYETPPRLMQQAARLGLDLEGVVKRNDAEILWQPQAENIPDRLAHRLLEAIGRRGVRRLFIDGLGGFLESAVEPKRTSRFFSVLTNELRARGVTTLYSMETREVLGSHAELPVSGISSLVESLLSMRFVQRGSSTRRLLSVIKVRNSDFDPTWYEFVIAGGSGISLGGAFPEAEEVPAGFGRKRHSLDQPASPREG